jgi:cell division protein FtsW
MDASIYRLTTRNVLVLCVLSLLLLGVLMVQSASTKVPTNFDPAVTDQAAWDWTGQAIKHIALAAAAFGVFLLVGRFDYRRLVRNTRISPGNVICWFYGITVLLCGLTLVFGKVANGAKRWLGFGPVQIQPSELAKWAVVLMLAWVLAYRQDIRDRFGKFLLLCLFIGIPCLLVVIHDFGTAALIGLVGVLMLVVGRMRAWHLAVVLPPILAVGFWFVYHKDYRWRRMTSFLNPFADERGEGYHMVQSLLAFASGGLLGRGLGNGVQKLDYLPEDTTDFIFSIICEELGLFGALLTIALFCGIGYVAWQVISGNRDEPEVPRRPVDPFAGLLVFGVTAMVCLQAIINMAVATVSVPTKGLSLPLVSAGGSGMLVTCAALGLIYSVARQLEADRLPLEDSAPWKPNVGSSPVGIVSGTSSVG